MGCLLQVKSYKSQIHDIILSLSLTERHRVVELGRLRKQREKEKCTGGTEFKENKKYMKVCC